MGEELASLIKQVCRVPRGSKASPPDPAARFDNTVGATSEVARSKSAGGPEALGDRSGRRFKLKRRASALAISAVIKKAADPGTAA